MNLKVPDKGSLYFQPKLAVLRIMSSTMHFTSRQIFININLKESRNKVNTVE